MEYKTLGGSDLRVSRICLGTMTWGRQNSEADAHAQLDLATAAGVNFIDTAEMYPIPPNAQTQGLTERYIGSWLAARGGRERLVIATKAAGPGSAMKHIRGGPRLDRSHLRAAVEASLARLQTDYIDLYQLHWPERVANYFGQLDYRHRPEKDGIELLETLQALAELVQEGKIRQIGVSNETPWGVMRYLQLAQQHGLPRMVSVQNPYSLLNRSCEVGLAEVMLREQVDLLAYSPLGFGVLSGKYLCGQQPDDGRLTLFPSYQRYSTPVGVAATERYVQLARDWGLDPAQMALAFVNSRAFLGGNIIGATTLAQLQSNLASIELTLSAEQQEALDAVHRDYSNPCP
ncbi:NADP(H)-dependent aldo-keto reductase [Motiliproteus sediminis]|uniref:NADP(H)-dependent aldo-keto reductase n=1 Tax=Motiliproteus sediminis TaxID=1468178 RepID=UPI001AF004A6|nr:NADP(H)-dependent aldo-keto reductase [Motiliproteus sediminis]